VASKVLLEEEKNLGGRPMIELSEDQLEDLNILSAICTLDEIADYFCIARETFRRIRVRDEEVFSLYKKGRVKAKKIMGSRLFKKGVIEGDTTAMIFYMKTQGGWKEAKEEPEEKPVKIETPEEIEAKMEEIRLYIQWKEEQKLALEKENNKKE
jgi:hypothetical protein